MLECLLSIDDHIGNLRINPWKPWKPRTPPFRKGMWPEENVEDLKFIIFYQPDENHETLWERLKPLILKDKSFDFSRLLRRSTDGCAHNLLFPDELFELICLKNAVKCATVLLEREASWRVDLNAPWKGGCLTPLQIAAMRLSYPLIELFLLHGAHPNHLPAADHPVDVEKLPLCLALETLRKQLLSDWGPEKSVFKLFYIFCLKKLREPLAAVKLLASRTEELEMICKHYLEKGEIHQLAALLQISWHALVNPSPDHDKGFEAFQIWQSICNELKSVSLSDSQRRTELQSAHKLLSVLYKARDYIEYFRLVYSNREAHDVPFLLANDLVRTTKISLKPEDVFSDDVKCLMPRISATRKAWLDKQIQKQMKSGFAASSEPRSKLYSRAFRPKSADPDEADKEESDDEYDPTDLEESLKRIFKQDNKDEFVKLMKSWPCDDVAALVFVFDMFEYDAVKCAGAILNGGEITDWKLRLDTFLFRIGYTPLHRSADHAALKLTGFLLDHGENANVPISTRTGDILPLHYALKKISYDNWWWKWWRHNKSVFGLLIICLWNKGLYLENVRLFAEHTKDIQLVVDKFVKERNLIELGILMLLGYRPSPKLLSVLKLDAKEPNDQLLGKMLEVFERIGNKLQAYSKIKWWISQNVVTEVYSLFEDAELVVTSKEIPIAEYDHLQHLQGARG